jgi:hypothetical protein
MLMTSDLERTLIFNNSTQFCDLKKREGGLECNEEICECQKEDEWMM